MATLTKGRGAFQAAYAALFLSCAHFVAPCGTLAFVLVKTDGTPDQWIESSI